MTLIAPRGARWMPDPPSPQTVDPPLTRRLDRAFREGEGAALAPSLRRRYPPPSRYEHIVREAPHDMFIS
ncbi:hypothetical protein DSO57_1036631 [Entomophthora muscae]|uniref:Uncharacterized protein n=1 Tax=Entomophthora muscae TaxID=34485 RepID=A0ACC2RDX8_9FUNG|nr:hypothetical protein DSO57_1036631 [Entomophthora muscae]